MPSIRRSEPAEIKLESLNDCVFCVDISILFLTGSIKQRTLSNLLFHKQQFQGIPMVSTNESILTPSIALWYDEIHVYRYH